MTLIYIHGFNSSPASFKAGLLRAGLAARGRADDFVAPALPHSPAAAAQALAELASTHPHAVLVGSSLGGYYATWLAEKFRLRAVLVNPAVRPYKLLAAYIGPQKNMHTGEAYDFTARHVDELRALEVDAPAVERYLLMVGTADEVLDYRQAVEKYHGARQLVIEGGDHGLSDFGAHIDAVFRFFGICDRSPPKL